MTNPRESGQEIPSDIADLELKRELIKLADVASRTRYGDWSKEKWDAKAAAEAQYPEKILEILRRQGEKRLLDIQIDPNELAHQLLVVIPPLTEHKPPTFIFINYTELEPIEPNIREVLRPYQKEFVRARYSVQK